MLIAFSKIGPDVVLDADLDLFLASDLPDRTVVDAPMNHYAWFRGVLRDGSALALGLSLTECAELYVRLRDDDGVRRWAETLSARVTPFGPSALASDDL